MRHAGTATHRPLRRATTTDAGPFPPTKPAPAPGLGAAVAALPSPGACAHANVVVPARLRSASRRRPPPVAGLACMLGATVLLAGCSLLRSDRDDAVPPLADIEPLASVETAWTTNAGAGIGRHWLVLAPAVVDGRVLVADARGRLSAFAADSGRSAWRTSTGADITGGVGSGGGLVVAGTEDGEVLAVSAQSGDIAWRAEVSSEVQSRPGVADGRVVVRTLDGKLFGLDAGSGEPRWSYDGGVPSLSVRGTSSPAIVGDAAVAGFDNGRLAAVRIENGEVLWEAVVSSARGPSELDRLADVDAQPVIVKDVVYAASHERAVAAFDIETGRALWRRDIESRTGLAADGDLVYVAAADGTIRALDRLSGATVWTESSLVGREPAWPAVHGAFVAVGDSEGYVHWLRREDGRPAARTRSGGSPVAGPPAIHGEALVVYRRNGRLAAYEVR